MLSRRELLTTASLAATAPLLAACPGTGTPSTPSSNTAQVISVAQNAVSTLSQEFSILAPSLSAAQQSTVGKIQAALADASGVLKPLSTTMSGNQALPGIQQAEQDFNAVVTAVSLVPLPPPYSTAVAALALSLPLIEGFINTYVPTASASLVDVASRKAVIAGANQPEAQAMAAKWQGK